MPNGQEAEQADADAWKGRQVLTAEEQRLYSAPSLDDQRIVALEARVGRLIEQVEALILQAARLSEDMRDEFPPRALRFSR